MNTKLQAHIDSAKELLELMSIAGWLALFADVCWVIRDSCLAGWPLNLVPILVILVLGLIIMSIGVYKYHQQQYYRLLHARLIQKIAVCKRKYKSKSK